VSRFARDVTDHDIGDYQRAVRLVLRHPLITAQWPDAKALPRVRRFSATLRSDLAEAFGYRLELHGSTARLVRTKDQVDPSQPARSKTDRPFDRQRYAYLMLCLSVLGRAGVQVTLSELADSVAADAARIPGLGLEPDRGTDRRAFVDAVAWLETRGALTLTDGSANAWASDPRAGEALYDVGRDIVFALYRPTRMIQGVTSVAALLDRSIAGSGNEERRIAAQAARRAVVERPVVYYADVADPIANHLRGGALAEDLQRLTGLRVERRAEGVMLVDTVNLSVERFPGSGSVAQVAILLAVAMADRVIDPDGRRVKRFEGPSRAARQDRLIALVDAGLPTATRTTLGLAEEAIEEPAEWRGDTAVPGRLPFIGDSFLRSEVNRILAAHATSFGADWHADPERLCVEAVNLLDRFGLVTPVPGGVLVLPLAGRYRNTVAVTRQRRAPVGLF
jgi:uncharacterized protein (TIGR02678 family)